MCKIFFVLLLFAGTTVFAQLPNNIGFESGNFDDWECSTGIRDRNSGAFMMSLPNSPVAERHKIIDQSYKNQLDYYGEFPMLCPNGSKYSVRLGDGLRFSQVDRISRTFDVPSGGTNYSIVFNYAVVLEDNNRHPPERQPVFRVQIFDATTNSQIPCPSFDFAVSTSLPGFKTSSPKRKPNGGADTIVTAIYKDWSTAMINLKAYEGKKIRLEFSTADCSETGHFGYAYLDIDEQLSLKPITGNVFCLNQNSTVLNGPTGFEKYTWYKTSDLTTPIGRSQSLPIAVAVDGDGYALELIPYDSGCIDTLYTTLKKVSDPFVLKVIPEVYGCPGTGVDLTALSITAGSSLMDFFSYYTDPDGLVYLPNPDKVLVSGTYYIRGTNAGGCTDILPVEVILTTPEISVTQPLPVRYPTKVDLSLTFTPLSGYSYGYFADVAGTMPIDRMAGVTGTYYIKATSGLGCSIVNSVKVVVNPPPPYTIEAPNVFTPNGDGINDNFSIKTTGYVSMTLLKIFNRYGQVVFTTKSINDKWAGSNGGSTLPEGTYYWIFEGTDDYFHTPVKQASLITIVR